MKINVCNKVWEPVFLAVQDLSYSSIGDLVNRSVRESDIFWFWFHQSRAELTFLTIEKKDEETWYDRDKDIGSD